MAEFPSRNQFSYENVNGLNLCQQMSQLEVSRASRHSQKVDAIKHSVIQNGLDELFNVSHSTWDLNSNDGSLEIPRTSETFSRSSEEFDHRRSSPMSSIRSPPRESGYRKTSPVVKTPAGSSVKGAMLQSTRLSPSHLFDPVFVSHAETSLDFLSSDRPIYQVQFKHMFRYCVMSEELSANTNIGSFVIVEVEKRGIDMGIVVSVVSMRVFRNQRISEGLSQDPEENNIYNIARLATTNERKHLPTKFLSEKTLLKATNHLVNVVYNIHMRVIGTEYQFDGTKLTVYYTSDSRIDYRDLVRDLFAKFHTRIWMKKINQCKLFTPFDFATVALQTGVLVVDGK